MRRFWPALDLPVLLAILICCMMGYAARYALNPDGISYLDLSAALQRGDWGHFVQGYWSPLYPVLLAIVQFISGASNAWLLPWVHGLDTLIIALTIGLIWWTARRTNNLLFGLAGASLVLLASGRLPRVETITPDILLGFVLTAIACELLTRGATHWIWLGVLFGLAFLTKTSSWPWMSAALLLSLVGAPSRASRMAALRVASVCAIVVLAWIIPMSLKYSSPTLGSSGRLNYCWYIQDCDSRTPDGHTGNHEAYLDVPVGNAATIRIAKYEDAAWTYQPWGDPTAWDAGITGGYTYVNGKPWILNVWGDLDPLLRIWTISVTLGILLPLFLVTRRKGMVDELLDRDRPAVLLMLIGILGMGQFVVVHAEPRLIAPFVLVAGLGVVHWFSKLRDVSKEPHPVRFVLLAVSAGWLWSVVLGEAYLEREFFFATDDLARIEANNATLAKTSPNAGAHPRIVLIGPAGLLMQDVWKVGGHVVAQVIKPKLSDIDAWPADQKQALLNALLPYQPDVIWVTLQDKSLAMIPVTKK